MAHGSLNSVLLCCDGDGNANEYIPGDKLYDNILSFVLFFFSATVNQNILCQMKVMQDGLAYLQRVYWVITIYKLLQSMNVAFGVIRFLLNGAVLLWSSSYCIG